MPPPAHQYSLFGVIVPIVVFRHVDGQSLAQVSSVLHVQRQGRVLRVSCHEEFPSSACHDHVDPRFVRLREQCQFLHLQDILPSHLRMPAVRHVEHVVESSEDRVQRLQRMMFEDAEHLFLERIFRHAIVVVESRLRRPADIERRGHVCACPVEYFRNLIPVAHLFEVHLLHGRPCDNHAVILLVPHEFEVRIESLHVFDGRILGRMTFYLHERDLYL